MTEDEYQSRIVVLESELSELRNSTLQSRVFRLANENDELTRKLAESERMRAEIEDTIRRIRLVNRLVLE